MAQFGKYQKPIDKTQPIRVTKIDQGRAGGKPATFNIMKPKPTGEPISNFSRGNQATKKEE